MHGRVVGCNSGLVCPTISECDDRELAPVSNPKLLEIVKLFEGGVRIRGNLCEL